MKVLDLFAGLRGWSDPWKERGHGTFTVDIDERFDVDLHADVMALRPGDLPWKPDVVLASPPCECFSVMTFGRNWNRDRTPKTAEAMNAILLVTKTLQLIAELQPTWWVMENPRAMLRKLLPAGLLADFERVTVTYCQYGEAVRKPTDLWGEFPSAWFPRLMCSNGAACHVRAPRGSTSGTQGDGRASGRATYARWLVDQGMRGEAGWGRALRAKVPAALSLELCLAAESSEVLV